jgi:hypothetical protein
MPGLAPGIFIGLPLIGLKVSSGEPEDSRQENSQ